MKSLQEEIKDAIHLYFKPMTDLYKFLKELYQEYKNDSPKDRL